MGWGITLALVGTSAQAGLKKECLVAYGGGGDRASRAHYVGTGVYHGVYDKALSLLPMAQQLRARIVHHLRPMADGSLLDLGCGTGLIGHAAAQAYPGTVLHGVDYSPDMALVAGQRGYAHHRLVVGETEGNLKRTDWARHFPDLAFDNVTMNMVSYMLEPHELQSVFHHAKGKLKPGGRFVMTILEEGQDDQAVLARVEAEVNAIPELTPDEKAKVMTANRDLIARARKYRVADVARLAENAGLRLVANEGTYGDYARLLVFERPE